MSASFVDRRCFHRLALAALGGMVAGTALGQNAKDEVEKDDQGKKPEKKKEKEIHVCRGLNSCKGQGSDGKNQCAGMGTCYTAAKIGCATENECKNQGGCGMRPGENECKYKGQGAVPLTEEAWPRARKRFEQRMRTAGKKFGPAPPGEDDDIRRLREELERALKEQEEKEQEKNEGKPKPKPQPKPQPKSDRKC
jgi:hypothetical protein